MGWIIFGLFVSSAILFILSLLQKDRTKELEKQVENMSIQLMQEMYQLKQKVKVMEEEFILESNQDDLLGDPARVLTRDDVLAMYEDGYSVTDIATITNREQDDIETMLASSSERKETTCL
ncbi:hypothetical protein [Evansella tamaricis]|uniref:Uncharacterized protein n=1 Tax=Evansella tamaricis TaxID=2069301 RepID=A0ABS6JF02_9BACI|nr:hypothetical protein [Evansella tamaricis]MBU9712261.1 hypothetical protein [Evansella tamaricis]